MKLAEVRRPVLERAAEIVLGVARSVLGELDLEVVLDRVLEGARELTGARYAAIGVLDAAGAGARVEAELARFITAGVDEETRASIGALPRGRGVLGELIRNPKPLRLTEVGAHPHSYGFPHGHPPMRTFLGVPVLVGGEPFGNLYMTEKVERLPFTEADEEAAIMLAELAGVAIENARRYTGVSERRDELERTVAALEVTTQISRAIGGQTDLDAILELVAKRGRAVIDARVLLIELQQDQDLVVAAGAGELSEGLIGRRVALEGTVADHALRTRRSQRLTDELNRARFEEHGLGGRGVQAEDGLIVRLINDILDVERMNAGILQLELTAVDVRWLVSEALQAVQATADAAGVTLRREIAPLTVLADGYRIVQALVNLVGNAVKFSTHGGVVSVSVARQEDHALFSVRDGGRGIPADRLESIFERFRQVDASDAREKGGTGLGLPIARGIVERHGGRMWAESREGDGATFRFTLPLAQAPSEPKAPPSSLSGARGGRLVGSAA